jgi:hypothetical protein
MLIKAIPVQRHPADENDWYIGHDRIVKGCYDKMRDAYFVTLEDGTEWVIAKALFNKLIYTNPISLIDEYIAARTA